MNKLSIAIEGIDGSGKRTLAENLQKRFNNVQIKSEIISFPRHKEDYSSDLVDKFLYNGLSFSDDSYKEVREGLLYTIDRMVCLTRKREDGKSIIDNWDEDKVLIFDRYLSSNFIHRCVNMSKEEMKVYISKMKFIEYDLLGLPKPDATIVLAVQPEVSYNNILKRGREMDDNETIESLTKAYNNLEYLCKLEDYLFVDCCRLNEDGKYEMLSREEITDKVWDLLFYKWM